jgi:hypothetical protein
LEGRLGQRAAMGIFTYSNPENQLERNHNKESIAILQNKKARMALERQSIAAEYIPSHKYQPNFKDYYSKFVKKTKQKVTGMWKVVFHTSNRFMENHFLRQLTLPRTFAKGFGNTCLINLMEILQQIILPGSKGC